MKKLLLVSLVAALAVGLASDVFAGQNPKVNLAIDIQARMGKRTCPVTYSSCSMVNWIYGSPAGATGIDAMVVVYGYDRFTAVAFGLEWDPWELAFVAYKKCSDLLIEGGDPSWGTYSAAQTWGSCQVATNPYPGESGYAVGWVQFNAYTGHQGISEIAITPSATGELKMVDCLYQPDPFNAVHQGYVGMAVSDSIIAIDHPCEMGPTATKAMTWSGVKALYK